MGDRAKLHLYIILFLKKSQKMIDLQQGDVGMKYELLHISSDSALAEMSNVLLALRHKEGSERTRSHVEE